MFSGLKIEMLSTCHRFPSANLESHIAWSWFNQGGCSLISVHVFPLPHMQTPPPVKVICSTPVSSGAEWRQPLSKLILKEHLLQSFSWVFLHFQMLPTKTQTGMALKMHAEKRDALFEFRSSIPSLYLLVQPCNQFQTIYKVTDINIIAALVQRKTNPTIFKSSHFQVQRGGIFLTIL